jgi:hypothetical protein
MKAEWISVKKGLPELSVKTDWGMVSKPVLCFHKGGHHEDCILNRHPDFKDETYWSYVQDDDLCESVTHWMPLPEPPAR